MQATRAHADPPVTARHRVFGLGLETASPLPFLDAADEADGGEAVRVRVAAPAPPRAPAPLLERVGLTAMRDAADGALHLDYGDGLRFRVDAAAREVAMPPGRAAMHFLLGPVLGCVLRLRGTTCLHASALVAGERALLLLGARGAGKSTAAGALAAAGLALLADDLAALEGGGAAPARCRPGPPGMRLWPPAAAALGLDPAALEPLRAGSAKRHLDLRGGPWPVARAGAPIAAVYLLAAADAGPPTIAPVAGREALLVLLGQMHASEIPGLGPGADDFERLGTLAERVPVRRVAAGRDLAALRGLADAIAADFEALAPAPARRAAP